MPKVPSILPQDLIQKSGADAPSPPALLMAAADLHSSGALADPQRSAPMPKDTRSAPAPRTPRKLKVLK